MIDVEIYISNLIRFFEENPNDLITLVGTAQKSEFYQKLRERSEMNFKENKDFVLTKDQIANIVLELKTPNKPTLTDLSKIIQKTKFGEFFLN